MDRPDGAFPTFRALNSVDRRFLCISESSIGGFLRPLNFEMLSQGVVATAAWVELLWSKPWVLIWNYDCLRPNARGDFFTPRLKAKLWYSELSSDNRLISTESLPSDWA